MHYINLLFLTYLLTYYTIHKGQPPCRLIMRKTKRTDNHTNPAQYPMLHRSASLNYSSFAIDTVPPFQHPRWRHSHVIVSAILSSSPLASEARFKPANIQLVHLRLKTAKRLCVAPQFKFCTAFATLHFANAFTATSCSHLTAWSSAEWRRARSPSENLVYGQDSTMWLIVCTSPHWHFVWCGHTPFVKVGVGCASALASTELIQQWP